MKVSKNRLDGTIPDEFQTRDIFVTSRGNADGVLRYELDGYVEQIIPFQAGEFIIARSRQEHLQGLAVWRGPHHEASVFLLPEIERDFSNPLKNFADLRFDDSVEGLMIGADPSSDLRISVAHIGIWVDGVGSLNIRPAETALAQVPTWQGAQASTGEVWQMAVDPEMDPLGDAMPDLILANASVVATLSPDAGVSGRRRDLAPQVNFLEGLRSLELTAQ